MIRRWIGAARARLGGERPPVVPVIRLHGIIGRAGGPIPAQGGRLDAAGLAAAIDRAFGYKRAPAVALAVNSPGGSPVQSALIASHIRRKAEQKKKPVLAFVEDVGASGGYWLACAGDEIHAHDCSIVGSIGVISASFGFVDAMRRIGVERRVHTAGLQKSMLDPFLPEDTDDLARLRTIQVDIHGAFKDLVRERRGGRLKRGPEDLFEGQVFTGREALDAGLVDGLGDMRGTLQARFGEKVRTPVMNAGRSWRLPFRFGRGGPDAGSVMGEMLQTVEERALWARFGL